MPPISEDRKFLKVLAPHVGRINRVSLRLIRQAQRRKHLERLVSRLWAIAILAKSTYLSRSVVRSAWYGDHLSASLLVRAVAEGCLDICMICRSFIPDEQLRDLIERESVDDVLGWFELWRKKQKFTKRNVAGTHEEYRDILARSEQFSRSGKEKEVFTNGGYRRRLRYLTVGEKLEYLDLGCSRDLFSSFVFILGNAVAHNRIDAIEPFCRDDSGQVTVSVRPRRDKKYSADVAIAMTFVSLHEATKVLADDLFMLTPLQRELQEKLDSFLHAQKSLRDAERDSSCC